MSLHKGEILKTAIEKSGMTVTRIVTKLKEQYKHIRCSRTRLYHLFKQREVNINLMLAVGKIIYHDFAKDLPGLKKDIHSVSESQSLKYYTEPKGELFLIRKEHAKLQKAYIELLSFLTKLANKNNDSVLKKAIENFLNKTDS